MKTLKTNIAIGRFQPFTKGHINMINEGGYRCLVFRINSDDIIKSLGQFKIKGKLVSKKNIENILDYIENQDIELSYIEKEILKKPFTNDLINKEINIIQKTNDIIVDITNVKNMFEGLMYFNSFVYDNKEIEPCYLMCGNDRVIQYQETIDKYDEIDHPIDNIKIPNVLKNKLKVNIGSGRIEGISGTELRNSIINKDKEKFSNIMPNGCDILFDDFIEAFNEFKIKLQNLI